MPVDTAPSCFSMARGDPHARSVRLSAVSTPAASHESVRGRCVGLDRGAAPEVRRAASAGAVGEHLG